MDMLKTNLVEGIKIYYSLLYVVTTIICLDYSFMHTIVKTSLNNVEMVKLLLNIFVYYVFLTLILFKKQIIS